MQHKSIFTNWDKDDLKTLIKESFIELTQEQQSLFLTKDEREPEEELLTRERVASFYSVSLVTLRDWEKNNIIPKPIRKGSRVYYRKSDIMNDIQKKGGDYVD